LWPDRIVLGGIDDRSIATLEELYRSFKGAPVLRTGTRTAEMIKYASNAALAALISFSNEIGNLCAALGGVDCEEVMQGVHLSHYLSPRGSGGKPVRAPITAFLRAGCGFGGSCLPKDVRALIARGKEVGCSMDLLKQVIRINERQPERMVDLLRRHFSSLDRLPVAVLGLAFKPDTDDLRESPAIPLVKLLLDAGAVVTLYDPVAMPGARRARVFDGATYAETLEDAVASAKAALLVTAWPEFRRLERMPAEQRRSLVVVDGRRLLDKNRFERYEGIGRGAPAAREQQWPDHENRVGPRDSPRQTQTDVKNALCPAGLQA
jgi:UDPglucose 6-dehydrogenase/GDP-mannose 6-dehydrogenase